MPSSSLRTSCPPLHWSSITENIDFKAEFTLSRIVCVSRLYGHYDKHSWNILLASFLRHLMAAIKVSVHTLRPHRSHGYYCAICPFSSGGNIIQKKKKKKPYADYDWPGLWAWAQVTRPCARVNLCPVGFSCCIKLDGLSNLKYCLNFLGKSAGCWKATRSWPVDWDYLKLKYYSGIKDCKQLLYF